MKNFFFDWEIISTSGFHSDLTPLEKLLLLYLKMKVDTGEDVPSQQGIAEDIGCSRKYVSQYLGRLIEKGLIRTKRFKDPYFHFPSKVGNFIAYELTFIPTRAKTGKPQSANTPSKQYKCKYCQEENIENPIAHFEDQHRKNEGCVEDFRQCWKLLFAYTGQDPKKASAKTKSYFQWLAVILPEHVIRTAGKQVAEKSPSEIRNLPGYFIGVLRQICATEGIVI